MFLISLRNCCSLRCDCSSGFEVLAWQLARAPPRSGARATCL